LSSSDYDDDDDDDVSTLSVVSIYIKSLLAIIVIWQFTFKISNAAVTALLRFLKQFLIYIGKCFENKPVEDIGNGIPLSLSTVYRLMSLQPNSFETYVVCPMCHTLYHYDACYETKFGQKISKFCSYVQYPNHPHPSQRKPCGTTLLKKVRRKGGYSLEPFKVYPYKSLRHSFEQLLNKRGFIESCEKWRSRKVPDDYLCDLYDGIIWNNFNSVEKEYFLFNPYCYLLTLNVDWFEPFERGVYSVGAIYLTCQNLPREERNKLKNIILVGILPGPKEPSKTINSYLTPLVQELKEAWHNGFTIPVQNDHVCVKLALTCVTCDIPATRKVCGFLSHNASMGCNKCLKKFTKNFGEDTDYSGYNREEWIPRTFDQHLLAVAAVQSEVTKTGQQSKESTAGVRYSVLLDLPYFNPCSFVAIDSMHNLFLGTGKHAFSTWINSCILSTHDLDLIEKRIKQFVTPVDVGRLPSNMKACYSSFTADQWKNWINVYSVVILKDILPSEHLRCWQLFVRSCTILCTYCIRRSDLTTADALLLQFCRQFERLYGRNSCTFNMHLHLHLIDTFLHFGPPHATWCYAFERFNGTLGSYYTNSKDIEPQIMRRFCQHQAILTANIPEDFDMSPIHFQEKPNKSIGNSLYLLQFATEPLNLIKSFAFTNEDSKITSPLPPLYEEVMDAKELAELEMIYKQLYPFQNIKKMSSTIYKFGRLLFAGDLIGSVMPGKNSHASSVIMAYWASQGNDISNVNNSERQVGVVQSFLLHKIYIGDHNDEQQHLFAYVKWKELHDHHEWYGISATVCHDSFQLPAACCFLPVKRIFCRCAYTVMPITLNGVVETVFISCPIPFKYCL